MNKSCHVCEAITKYDSIIQLQSKIKCYIHYESFSEPLHDALKCINISYTRKFICTKNNLNRKITCHSPDHIAHRLTKQKSENGRCL